MKIKRYNYPQQFQNHTALSERIAAMLLRGDYVLGKDVAHFEQRFADYVGVDHGVGVNSGTDALIMALLALNVGPGDEVITQANTFHATVSAIRITGATPVLVDAHPETYLMDLDALEAAVTPRTRVVLPVHLFGKPTEMAPITALARTRELKIIEDAAQAHGARLHGQRVGSFGDLACFSFHPSKNLAAAGDAGMVVTNNPALAEDLRIRRGLGQQGQNHHVMVGMNSKLDGLQALVLDHKLDQLDHWNAQRRRVARAYRNRLADLPLGFQPEDPHQEHVYHLFQIRTEDRDALMTHLRDRDVDATVRYPVPIHLQPAFADQGWQTGQFPVAEALARELLCLPMRPDMGDDELDYTCAAVRAFFGAQP